MPEEESGFKPRMRSIYSMGQLDFFRLHGLLEAIDMVGVNIHIPDNLAKEKGKIIWLYFGNLYIFYINIRPIIISDEKQKEKAERLQKAMDIYFEKAQADLTNWMTKFSVNPDNTGIPVDIVKKLVKMHMILMELKQQIGIGIEMKGKIDIDKKLRSLEA